MSGRAALALAGLATTVGSLVLGLIRFAGPVGVAATSPDAALPWLLTLALVCAVALTIRRRPTVAWLAATLALSIATVDIATALRSGREATGGDPWPWLPIAVCLAAVAAVAASAAYAATRPGRTGRWIPLAGGVAVAWVFAVGTWALATPASIAAALGASPLGNLGLVTRSFLVAVAGLSLIGAVGDTRASATRASQTLAARRAAPTTIADRVAYRAAWLKAVADDLAPGRTRAHRAALSERSRIARDLHADVVPAVRRALAEAERDGSAERLAASLRDVLHEVDALIGSQHAIELEVGGFVAALESLAERVEDRSDVRVSIDVEDDGVPGATPPAEVATAAFRVAGLALENVIRHAPGSSVGIAVSVRASGLHMTIQDDGPGIPSDRVRTALADGHRGLADMVAEASGCGAIVEIGARPDGTGTRLSFRWPAS